MRGQRSNRSSQITNYKSPRTARKKIKHPPPPPHPIINKIPVAYAVPMLRIRPLLCTPPPDLDLDRMVTDNVLPSSRGGDTDNGGEPEPEPEPEPGPEPCKSPPPPLFAVPTTGELRGTARRPPAGVRNREASSPSPSSP